MIIFKNTCITCTAYTQSYSRHDSEQHRMRMMLSYNK